MIASHPRMLFRFEHAVTGLCSLGRRAPARSIKVYKDHGISGAKGRDRRPAFNPLCRDATKRQFDVIMAWSVDRLGRSLQDLISFLSHRTGSHARPPKS
jgi:DNA invertase Pin-like site-specific DNA recombinase